MDQPMPNASVWTEVAGIARELGHGNRSALTRLYDVSAPRLLRYSEMLTRNRADAEDAFQSALMRIARKPKLLAAADRPWAYLVTVVRNESLKIVERRRPGMSLASMLASSRSEECPLEQEESRAQVQVALKKLPTQQSEVIVLKIWEEFTFAEIADLLGESPNTVASRYRYAIEKLEKLLQPLAESRQAAVRNESPVGSLEVLSAALAPAYSAEVGYA